jgi:DNA gyrase subunit A
VTLIAVEDGTKLSGLQRIVETDIDEVELEPSGGNVAEANEVPDAPDTPE